MAEQKTITSMMDGKAYISAKRGLRGSGLH